MKAYLLSLAVGILVGVIYGLLDERSPAPPVVVLIGQLGIFDRTGGATNQALDLG